MNAEHYITFMTAFQSFKWAKQNKPNWVMSFQESGDKFVGNIESGIENARIFEVEEDIKKMLCLTDTPMENDEVKLPFNDIFLDIEFTKEELADFGIEIDANKITGVLAKEGVLMQRDNDGKEIMVGTDLNLTMLSEQNNKEVWFDTFNKNPNITKEFGDYGFEVKENPTTDKKARDFVHKFFLNFLNFVNSPNVEYVEHKRTTKNRERRLKQGKTPIPSTLTIRLDNKLRVYIDDLVRGGKFNYNYSFWVRGHFRTLKSARYGENQGKRIWIIPYVKGDGVLIEKTYRLKGGNQKNVH